MEKFLKSIFQPNEKSTQFEASEGDRNDIPPLNGRRNLSTSRSGRMKQANKKRLSLTLDIYGENENHSDLQTPEKPKSVEYHVNRTPSPSPMPSNAKTLSQRHSTDDDIKTPEEEIDIAFKIIEKS